MYNVMYIIFLALIFKLTNFVFEIFAKELSK